MGQFLFTFFTQIIYLAYFSLFFLIPFLFTRLNSELFEMNKMLGTYFLTCLVLGAWLGKSIICKPIFRRSSLDIPLILFLVSQTISTIHSLDPHTSFWGYYSRSNGGLLSTISYLVLYWGFVSNMKFETALKCAKLLLISASFIAIWGILEHFGKSISCIFVSGEFNTNCWIQDVQTRVFATLGQPNWLAAWLVAISPLVWWGVQKSENPKQKALFVIVASMLFLTIIFTKSRSGLIGLATASFIFWGILFLFHKPRSAIFKPFFILYSLFLILIAIFGSPVTPALVEKVHWQKTVDSITTGSTALESGGTESGQIRKIVWKGALEIWKNHPIFGTGVETFAYSYYQYRPQEHNQTSEWDLLYNKAHNEYLNYLANTGAIGLTTYLILIVFVIFNFFKLLTTRYSLLTAALAAGFVSILVTNFFGFSVVATSLLFFLYPAIASVLLTEHTSEHQPKLTFSKVPLLVAVFVATCLSLWKIWSLWYADTLYAQADKYLSLEVYDRALSTTAKAIRLRDEPLYYDRLAQSAAAWASDEEDKETAQELASLAQDSSDYALSISPYSLPLLKSRTTIAYKLSFFDPKYLQLALPSLEAASVLAPTDAKVYYNLGVLYERLGELEKARETLEKTVSLRPNYYDARLGLAEVYIKIDKKDKAKIHLQYILDFISPEDPEVLEKFNSP